MIAQITKKIMHTGLERFAKEIDTDDTKVQIRISIKEEGSLKYEMCENWKIIKEVDFKYILNKKIDFLGYEQMAVPVLVKSLIFYAENEKIEYDNISIFLSKHGKTIVLSIYDKVKNIANVLLEAHLTSLQIE